MRTVAFCEIDPFCRRVLAKHWPDVPCYNDVRVLTAERLAADGIFADVVCGGFPCQDISNAGTRTGLLGERSKLWFEFSRLIRELRPAYAVVENSAALLGRGLGHVLGDLAAIGYDAEWHCIPARAVGARHIRDRTWVIAYPADDDRGGRQVERLAQHCDEQGERRDLTDRLPAPGWRAGTDAADAPSARLLLGPGLLSAWQEALSPASAFDAGGAESAMVRGLHGTPSRVDRVRALGNAVVPQITEVIGRALLAGNT